MAGDTIARARNGDREAFARLVREHHPRVLLLCRSFLGGDAAADDAAQEVFLKAFRRLHSFDGRSQFATWLHRIASNHCLDLLRKRAREKTEPLEGLQASDKGAALAALEAKHEVRALLQDLPENQKSALILREMQGYTYEEIARSLDCSLDSVKARLRRAREHLARKMRHFDAPPSV